MKKIEINVYPNDWQEPFTLYQANYPNKFKTPTIELNHVPTKLIKEPYSIYIEANNSDEAIQLAASFHEALKGNEDYVKSNILLNISLNRIHLYVFKESRTFVGLKKTYI